MTHESVNDIVCDLVNSVIIVTVLGEVALNLIVDCNSVFVSDRLYLCILYYLISRI